MSRPCRDGGRGGGGIAGAAIATALAAVLVDAVSRSWTASSPEVGGDANRAVGRGPDEEGPLDFFKIGWAGGGREDEGVNPFLLVEEVDLCPGLPGSPPAGSWASVSRPSRSAAGFCAPSQHWYTSHPAHTIHPTLEPLSRLVGAGNGTNVGPVENSSKSLASSGPLRFRNFSLPQTCHQKFSNRNALGSKSRRKVVVYTIQAPLVLLRNLTLGPQAVLSTVPILLDLLGRDHWVACYLGVDFLGVLKEPQGHHRVHFSPAVSARRSECGVLAEN